jgi:hypothetical protein
MGPEVYQVYSEEPILSVTPISGLLHNRPPYSNLNLRILTFISNPIPIIMVMIDDPP